MHDEGMRLLSKGTGFYLRQWITARIRKYCYACRRNAELLDSRLRHPPLLRSKEGADTRSPTTRPIRRHFSKKRIRTGFPSSLPRRPSPAAHRTARKMETGRFINRGFPEGSRRLSGSGTGDRRRRTGTGQPQTTGKRPQLTDSIRFIGAVYDPKRWAPI